MGFRFRKSINLGGGFKVNISKSGIGYSWGIRGYRVTKTSRGTHRTTISIPGTGISYVEESGRNTQENQEHNIIVTSNHYDEHEYINEMNSLISSENCDEILFQARKSLKLLNIGLYGSIISLILSLFIPFCCLFLICFLILLIYVKLAGVINLDYEIDEDTQNNIKNKMLPIIKIASSAKTWRIISSNKVIDTKYSAGATNEIKRINCKTCKKAVFPFKSKASAVSFITPQETVIFLPDKLYVIQGNKITAVNYSDIEIETSISRFIEEESVPRDAKVVDKTWKYVNKSGRPDKRFKNNIELPICLYGKLELTSSTGLNTIIMFSKSEVD